MHRGRLFVEMATRAPLNNTNNDQPEKENDEESKEKPASLNPSPSVLQEINLNSVVSTHSPVGSMTEEKRSKYYVSPLQSGQSDFDDSDCDPNFVPRSPCKGPNLLRAGARTPSTRSSNVSSSNNSSSSRSSSNSSSSSSSTDNETEIDLNPVPSTRSEAQHDPESHVVSEMQENRIGKKRFRNSGGWKSKVAKTLRNTGKAYQSATSKQMPEKKMGPTCGDKCRLGCRLKMNDTSRQEIFNTYWGLGDLQKQREFIIRHTTEIKPKYRYSSTQNLRKLNTAFYFQLNDNRIRVCKTFFKNTLALNDRPISTAISKKTETGFIQTELRGKHGKQRTVEPDVYESVKRFINTIPRIESHYLRAQTSREYIQCDKSLADLYRDYKEDRVKENLPFASTSTFNRIFNKDFNISFHTPKKDQCDLCESYKNADEEGKQKIIELFEKHLKEKELSREEKGKDKARVDDTIVAVYDLQAVMPIPKGQISVFFYKSRINCFNFTVSDLHVKNVDCFFWDETEGKRGAVEIGSCILYYINKKTEVYPDKEFNFIFYSDNCCGQQKNKYVLAAYAYAVQNLNIKSITHKFLIRGHSQNEGDNVHSVIEKQVKRFLKASPIYVPQQYVTLIQTAKKTGPPYTVNEMTHDKFYDLKSLQEEWGNNFNLNDDKDQVKWHDIKVLRVEKENPFCFFYKNSYEDEYFQKVCVRSTRRARDQTLFPVGLTQAYLEKIPLSHNKKRDIKELLDKNIIPKSYYESYFKNLNLTV